MYKMLSSFTFILGTEEMALWLRASMLLQETWAQLSTYKVAHNLVQLHFQGIWCRLLTTDTHTMHIHTCRQNIHTHKIKFKKLKLKKEKRGGTGGKLIS